MPVISRFLGISIKMYYHEHEPPHFHVLFAGRRAIVEIRTGVVRGPLPQRAARRVRVWSASHRDAIECNWERARRGEPLLPIPPLE
ncbi:MAG: DUF4160 domain-containing protein [Gemmatimonadaceae bacterium]